MWFAICHKEQRTRGPVLCREFNKAVEGTKSANRSSILPLTTIYTAHLGHLRSVRHVYSVI